MSIDFYQSDREQQGFSLLEVLVALAIVTVIMAIVAPLSRHIVRMISAIETDLASLALQDAVVMQAPAAVNLLNKTHPRIEMRTRAMKLAPFDYDPSAKSIWQPVLGSIEIRMPDGRLLLIEHISLKREGK